MKYLIMCGLMFLLVGCQIDDVLEANRIAKEYQTCLNSKGFPGYVNINGEISTFCQR